MYSAEAPLTPPELLGGRPRRLWAVEFVNPTMANAGRTVMIEATDTILDVKVKIARMVGCTVQRVRLFLEPVNADALHFFEVQGDSTLFVLIT